MTDNLKKEIKSLIKSYKLYCKVKDFQDVAPWKKLKKDDSLSKAFKKEFSTYLEGKQKDSKNGAKAVVDDTPKVTLESGYESVGGLFCVHMDNLEKSIDKKKDKKKKKRK